MTAGPHVPQWKPHHSSTTVDLPSSMSDDSETSCFVCSSVKRMSEAALPTTVPACAAEADNSCGEGAAEEDSTCSGLLLDPREKRPIVEANLQYPQPSEAGLCFCVRRSALGESFLLMTIALAPTSPTFARRPRPAARIQQRTDGPVIRMRLFKRRPTAPPGPTGPVSADALHWDHVQKSTLPFLHDDDEPTQPRHISGACFSTARPTPLANPFIVVSIPSALALIDLPADEPRTNPNFVDYVSGGALPPGSEPISHCYAGYQFGTFAGQLGDGAAISLGEVVNKRGERWDVQLKGAGRTHYSRTADGRKVLRSSLRELLASEAMHALGIPTTRAAALAASSSTLVARDIHYNGDVIHEKASVLMRLAPSFLRFGSFEIAKAGGPSPGQHVLVGKLVDHTCKLLGVKGRAAAFGEMVVRTASLAAAWMSVGFCHSVLNTDNMSVLGLTLDCVCPPRLWFARTHRAAFPPAHAASVPFLFALFPLDAAHRRPIRLHGGLRPKLREQLLRQVRPVRLRPAARGPQVELREARGGPQPGRADG